MNTLSLADVGKLPLKEGATFLAQHTSLNDSFWSNNKWLYEWHASVSRDGTVVAFAYQHNIVLMNPVYERLYFFEAQCETEESGSPTEKVTCVQVLILNEGTHDTTCVAVGYSSGYVRVFTEKGELVMSHQLHLTSVTQMRLMSGVSAWHHADIGEQNESFTIIYSDGVVVCIDGLNLHSALRACILLAERKGSEAPSTSLDYRKWEFSGVDKVSDIAVCCIPSAPSPFDDQAEESSSSSQTHFVVIGNNPAISFYAASQETSTFSSAVALASTVATKLTSAVVSFAKNWWGGGSAEEITTPTKKEKTTETPLAISPSSCIDDPKRQGQRMCIDPTGCYAAITDNLGRVLLLDCIHHHVLRMWKGYRQAQCAWLQPGRGYTQYLAIYVPKRGLLEVWPVLRGDRVGILHLPTHGRLFNTDCPLGGTAFSPPIPSRCFFIAGATVQEVVVGMDTDKVKHRKGDTVM